MTDTQRGRAALILTHNRPELLTQCIAAIEHQVDRVLVIDNASEPPARVHRAVTLLRLPDQPPNLARWWNLGFSFYASLYENQPYDVAVLCDDAIVPEGWFAAVTDAMAASGAVAGCSDPWGYQHPPQVKTAPDSDLMGRMVGWAFVLDATKEIRANESMHWWFFDTSLDFSARLAGGMCMIGGYPVPNRLPNDYTSSRPELTEQAGRDREQFAKVWGFIPW